LHASLTRLTLLRFCFEAERLRTLAAALVSHWACVVCKNDFTGFGVVLQILQGGSFSRCEVGSHSRAAVSPVGANSVTLDGYLRSSRRLMFPSVYGVELRRELPSVLCTWSTVKLPPRCCSSFGSRVPLLMHIAEMVRC